VAKVWIGLARKKIATRNEIRGLDIVSRYP